MDSDDKANFELAAACEKWRETEARGDRLAAEVARLARELAQKKAELVTAAADFEMFAGSVSHDVRAPLRHIQGYTVFLENTASKKLEESERQQLEKISSAAKRMGLMIEELVKWARIGRGEIQRRDVDMNPLVAETIEKLQPVIANRNIVWNTASLPTARGDANLLRQVWIILISNAVKFSAGRNPAKIEISGDVQGSEAVFRVRDNGAGFKMDYAEKLFGVFQRLHPVNQFDGMGMGLANVRRIIQLHGGRTWAEGAVDEGATFYFSLPA